MATRKKLVEEATKSTVTVTFNDEEYEIASDPNKIPFAALEAFEDGKPIAFLRAMLGTKDYARLKKSVQSVADFNDFMDAVLTAVGVDPKDLDS